jgi:hypothetical protein
MKTRITSILTLSLLALTVSAVAGTGEPSLISKINASGNVIVYISQGSAEDVKVSGKYDDNRSLIESENGELKIASYGNETLEVLVTVTDLKGIEADGTAAIKSLNKLNSDKLDVKLNDSSSAMLDSDETLVTEVSKSASLILEDRG